MKKIAIVLSLCAVIAACSNDKPGQDSSTSSNETVANSTAATTQTSAATGNSSSKGAQLLASSDCLGCHKEQEKLVGPAYKDVAAKYASNDENIDKLAKKVIAGGSGVWGDVPMTPHPALALNDAKEMVKYILSIK